MQSKAQPEMETILTQFLQVLSGQDLAILSNRLEAMLVVFVAKVKRIREHLAHINQNRAKHQK